MIKLEEIKVTDSGHGYTVGELAVDRHKDLDYLGRGTLVCQFEGVDTALDYVSKNYKQPRHMESSVQTGDFRFNTFDSYDEAMLTFRQHPEKVVKFDPSELRIKDESESGSYVDYDVVGDYIDMGRYMEGIPESVGTMHRGNARNRRVNITIDLNQRANIDQEVAVHRSERILRLIDALEAGGVRTMLTGIVSSECAHVEVTIKHHDEPLTITDLAVATHPEFLRRTVFRIIEHSKTWQHGYGNAVRFGELLEPDLIETENAYELDIAIGSNFYVRERVDEIFDQAERLLVWEMSKPSPEVSAIKMDAEDIWFKPNGARNESDIRLEGLEAINAGT